MRGRLRLTLLAAAILAAAPGVEPRAQALSCAIDPDTPAVSPYSTHELVLEGIPLSGPGQEPFGLGSPARVLVVRWVRGTGPRVVLVKTSVDFGVGPIFGHMPGYFDAHPGRVVRLFAGPARRNLIDPNPCVFEDKRPWPRSPLVTIPRTATRAAAGRHAWTARARRGPHGLHCVSTHPVRAHSGGQDECDVARPLLAVHHAGPAGGPIDSTAVVVAGPGIEAAQLRTPDGPIALRRAAPDRPLLAVLPGYVEAAEVRARLAMANGPTRWLQPVGFPTSPAPDPEGGRPWYSLLDRTRRGACVGVRQVGPRDAPADDEEVLDVASAPLCRARKFFYSVDVARPFSDSRVGVVPEPVRTVVFGVAAPPFRTVAIRTPQGVRRVTPGRGGQFLAVYPASTRRADVEVTPER